MGPHGPLSLLPHQALLSADGCTCQGTMASWPLSLHYLSVGEPYEPNEESLVPFFERASEASSLFWSTERVHGVGAYSSERQGLCWTRPESSSARCEPCHGVYTFPNL